MLEDIGEDPHDAVGVIEELDSDGSGKNDANLSNMFSLEISDAGGIDVIEFCNTMLALDGQPALSEPELKEIADSENSNQTGSLLIFRS